tara:strand:- start:132 stop:632 length:501 start_codon:yes stop_codon:yes gene_type:complete
MATMTTDLNEVPFLTSKLNVYRYNQLNGMDQPMTPMTHVPPEKMCLAMDKVRKFIELNNLKFEICPISEKRICIREMPGDLSEDTEGALHEAIFETTGFQRKIDRWGSRVLCWCAYETQEINTNFDVNEIKTNYEKYKMDYEGAKEWSYDWIKSARPTMVKSAVKM